MKIAIAVTSSSGQLSGVQRHAINLARCLLTREQITAVHLIAAPWQMELVHDAAPRHDARLHLHTAAVRNNTSLSRNAWYYADLPRIAARLQTDVVHLGYPAPLHNRAYHCPAVVTLRKTHDPYDPAGARPDGQLVHHKPAGDPEMIKQELYAI